MICFTWYISNRYLIIWFASTKTKRNSSNWISTQIQWCFNVIDFFFFFFFFSWKVFSVEKTSMQFDIDGNTLLTHLFPFIWCNSLSNQRLLSLHKMHSSIFVISSDKMKQKTGKLFFFVGIKFCTSKMKWKNFHQIFKLWNQFSLVPMKKKTRMENKYNIKWMKIHHQAILNGATQFFSYYTM